jgi:hypothetical protein
MMQRLDWILNKSRTNSEKETLRAGATSKAIWRLFNIMREKQQQVIRMATALEYGGRNYLNLNQRKIERTLDP